MKSYACGLPWYGAKVEAACDILATFKKIDAKSVLSVSLSEHVGFLDLRDCAEQRGLIAPVDPKIHEAVWGAST